MRASGQLPDGRNVGDLRQGRRLVRFTKTGIELLNLLQHPQGKEIGSRLIEVFGQKSWDLVR
jgi:hypothetical protein